MKGPVVALLALVGVLSSAVEAKGVFKKAPQISKIITSAAVNIPSGNYVLQNVGTKKWMAYSRTRGVPDVVASNKPTVIRLRNVGSKKIVLQLERYCMSSQWNYDLGQNHVDTLYRCCKSATAKCDNGNKKDGPLRNAKQHHYFVSSKSSALRITTSIVQKRDLEDEDEDNQVLPDEFENFEPDFATDAVEAGDDDIEVEELEETEEGVLLDKRASKKKRKFMGEYTIVARDHLHDMRTQSISGLVKVAVGRQKSNILSFLNIKDKRQQWRLYRLV